MTQHHFDPDLLALSSHPVMNTLLQSLHDCDVTVKKATGCVTLRPTEETGHWKDRCTVKAAPATSGQIHSACCNQATALSFDPAGKQMHLFEDFHSGGCAAAASPVEGCLGLPSGSAEGQPLPF